jgi:hypothetical protein
MAVPIVAVAALVGMAESAAACSHGYHRVKIQGNWICATNAPFGNSFVANHHSAARTPFRTRPLWGARMRSRF